MPASPPDLATLQSSLLGAIGGTGSIDPREVFLAPPGGTVEARWHVYETGYLTRLVEALEHDFPAVARIAGPAAFEAACCRYLRALPPCSHDIGRAGDRFADWLAGDALATRLPFLPDLARLEWALADAFVAEDATATRWEELVARGAEAMADVEIAPLPGTRVIRSAWPLPDLHDVRHAADEHVDVPVKGRPVTLVVHRCGLEATWQPIGDADAAFLESLGAGRTLASLIEALGEEAQPALVDELVATFRRMVEASILRIPPTNPSMETPRP